MSAILPVLSSLSHQVMIQKIVRILFRVLHSHPASSLTYLIYVQILLFSAVLESLHFSPFQAVPGIVPRQHLFSLETLVVLSVTVHVPCLSAFVLHISADTRSVGSVPLFSVPLVSFPAL